MSRLPTVAPARFTAAQQALFEHITQGKRGQKSSAETFLNPDGGLRGPFNALVYAPNVGDPCQQLGAAVRFDSTLSPHMRELAILTVAAHWQAQYEWWAHEKIAREEGLDDDIIAGVKAGVLPNSVAPDLTVTHRFARELLDQRRVSDQLYAETVALLGESKVVELVILLGYYTLISMTLNVFEVPLPVGQPAPFARSSSNNE